MANFNARFLTPTEELLMGGSPQVTPKTPDENHVPMYLLEGTKIFEEVLEGRKQIKTFTGLAAEAALDMSPFMPILSLSEVDRESKQTTNDSDVVALLDQLTGVVRELDESESRQLTERLYKRYYEGWLKHRDPALDLHLREPWKSIVEGSVKPPETRG